MWHKPCRTFHPWCPCIKTRCLSVQLLRTENRHVPDWWLCMAPYRWQRWHGYFDTFNWICAGTVLAGPYLPDQGRNQNYDRYHIAFKCLIKHCHGLHRSQLWRRKETKQLQHSLISVGGVWICATEWLSVECVLTEGAAAPLSISE